MKVCVVGSGAVGGYFGSLLFRAGADTTFVGRGESVGEVKKNGLIVNDISYPVIVTDNFQEILDPDLVLLAVKSYHLSEITPKLSHLSKKTIVICLQNGIDNDLLVKSLAPNLDVHPGLVYVSAQRISPGVISQTGNQKTLIFGRRDGVRGKKFIEMENFLRKSAIDATFSTDIQKDLWQKFIFVVSFAAVTAKFQTSIGPALKDPVMRNFYLQSLQEVIDVARAEGINLDSDIYEKTLHGAEKFPPETKSSFLVDLENHRQTELDTLHGTVVRLAQKHHLPVPANQSILDLFSQISAS